MAIDRISKHFTWKELKVLGSWYGARHTQCLFLFLLMLFTFATKAVMSVAIVAITDPTLNPDESIPTYSWNDKDVILSSFLWGCAAAQMPSAKLSTICGAKRLLILSMLLNGLVSCLIPLMASLGSWPVIICRLSQGLALGTVNPSCHVILGKWAPVEERSRMATFLYAGGQLGTAASLLITGSISSSSLGWPYTFYLLGGLCFAWSVVYFFVGKNSPADHKTIDPAERMYIETSLGHIGTMKAQRIPWREILSSVHVWAIVVAHCGQCWGFWTLLTNIPKYMNGMFNFNLQQNGLLSAGPYLALFICSSIFSKIADHLVKRKRPSIGVVRKIFNSIGTFVPTVSLVVLGIIGSLSDNVTVPSLVLLHIAVAAEAASFSGFLVNHLDLSTVHAGILMGISNGFAMTLAIFAPLTLQWIVTDESDPLQWASAFYISSGLFVVCNIFFLLFASGEIQPWNVVEEMRTEKL